MVNLVEGTTDNDDHIRIFNERVDDRIDRKFDRFKLWMFGALLANCLPVIGIAWVGGSTLSGVEHELRALRETNSSAVPRFEYEMFRAETTRRIEENRKRLEAVEKYHKQ